MPDQATWQAGGIAEFGDGPVSDDTLFNVLSHEHRRLALSYLLEVDCQVHEDELVAAVADQVAGASETDVATAFHHAHLPKMDAAGVIEHDGKFVAAAEAADRTIPPVLFDE